MISFTNIFLLAMILIIGYAFYKDTKNEIWNLLFDKFKADSTFIRDKDAAKVQAVYFKKLDDLEFDNFNSMK
ncbi:MAG: hypothetical protein HRT37_24355 [Alteromonadaceae bacterium]|nr:hypothetical protein [Alteromonadaceae bacterium]